MIEARRRAYLEALGFDIWLTRSAGSEPGWLTVGPGSGSMLLVCAEAADRTTDLAKDLARAIGGEPVWGWLDGSSEAGGQVLGDVISGRLITRVVLFGAETARRLLQGKSPEFVGSAAIAMVPSLQELAVSGFARQSLWQQVRKWQQTAGADSR